jgi:hypothetical protein
LKLARLGAKVESDQQPKSNNHYTRNNPSQTDVHAAMMTLVDVPVEDLRALLETLDPGAREHLRSVLIRDQADRDAISSRLMRYRDGHGDDCADIIDMLTMHPEERR